MTWDKPVECTAIKARNIATLAVVKNIAHVYRQQYIPLTIQDPQTCHNLTDKCKA